MKKVLVTGATGGLGRNAVEYLLEKGVQVVATGRDQQRGAQLEAAGAKFVRADLSHRGPGVLESLVDGVDAVWHCAALSSPWGAYADFAAANIHATANLVEAAGLAKVPNFVHISTPALYFDYSHNLDIPESFRAERYVNHYAATKAVAETTVQKGVLRFPNTRHVILRPRAIFGPYDQVLLPRLDSLRQEHRGRIPLPRGGRTVLDLTYAANVAHAMWLASTARAVTSGSVYNVTNDSPQQIGEVLEQLYAQRGQSFAVKRVPYPVLALAARVMERISRLTAREPKFTRYSIGALAYDMTLDVSKIKAELGYVPIVSMDEGIRLTAEWMKKHG